MFKGARLTKGYTLPEILLVVAIIGIIAALGATIGAQSLGRNELRASTWGMLDSLRRAQSEAMSGRQDSNWGVHFESNKYVFFKGSAYNAVDPDNETTDLKPIVTITAITLNGGGSDVVFSKTKGETTTHGSITVRDNNTNETRTITINSVGMTDYN